MRSMRQQEWEQISWFGPDDVPDWDKLDADLLVGIEWMAIRLQTRPVFTSTYRSPEKQQDLIQKGLSTAQRSLHLDGKAGDVVFPGKPLEDVYQAAIEAGFKGIGLYPETDSIHVDTRENPGTWSRIEGKYLALTAALDWIKKKRAAAIGLGLGLLFGGLAIAKKLRAD